MLLFDVFVQVMLPLLAVAGLGAWVARRVGIAVRPLNRFVFHLLAPALVFHTLATLEIESDLMVRVVAVVALVFAAMALVGSALPALLGQRRSIVAATTLCAVMPNSGNMGLPISALAFGSEGLSVAVVAFVTSSVLANSGGIVIASLAGRPVRGALLAPLRVPALWAVPPGLLISLTQTPLPVWLDVTAETLAGAAIPAMLVVLGLQFLARMPRPSDLSRTAGALALRLLAGPVVAAGITTVIGLGGVPQRTMIVLGGMPTAVMATIIAAQYDAEPEFVSRAVVISTALSFVTLTLLIALLP